MSQSADSSTQHNPSSSQPHEASWTSTVASSLLVIVLIQQILKFPIQSLIRPLYDLCFYIMRGGSVFSQQTTSQRSLPGAKTAAVAQLENSSNVKNELGLGPTSDSSSSHNFPKGLGNWDNSCYQNSILQALSAVPSIRNFLEQAQNATATTDRNSSTTITLYELFNDLNDPATSAGYLWTPLKLKSMSSWQQQDAQEYYSKLVDEMGKELALAFRNRRLDSHSLVFPSADLTQGISSQCSTKPDGKDTVVDQKSKTLSLRRPHFEEHPLIPNPVEGLLAQRVGCTRCGHTDGLSLIPFNCLTLPLGTKWSYDIYDCLDSFTSLDYIEGVDCAKCTLLHVQGKLQTLLAAVGQDDSEAARLKKFDGKQQAEIEERLSAVNLALDEQDFAENTLAQKCHISGSMRVSSVKSRQAIIIQMPKCLVLHLNRSVFDEFTGEQRKNHADVTYDEMLDLAPWSVGQISNIGSRESGEAIEEWEMNPSKSMMTTQNQLGQEGDYKYELKSLVMHQGRHEDGHYICYRRFLPSKDVKSTSHSESENYASQQRSSNDLQSHQWWRISDENVLAVDENDALTQGAAFMLFYERIKGTTMPPNQNRNADPSHTHEEQSLDNELTDVDMLEPVLDKTHPQAHKSERCLTTEPEPPTTLSKDPLTPSNMNQKQTDNAQRNTTISLSDSQTETDSTHEGSEFLGAATPDSARSISPITMRTAGSTQFSGTRESQSLTSLHAVTTT